jgi:hypothetical protein
VGEGAPCRVTPIYCRIGANSMDKSGYDCQEKIRLFPSFE